MEVKKNPDADIEKSKRPLALVGLVTALAVVLLAFEWASFDYVVADLGYFDEDVLEEEEIPISVQQNQPPPPPPPKPQLIIEIVDDEEEVEEEIEFEDTEVDQDTEIAELEEEEEVVEDEIFTIVETMPSFPGGDAALFKYLGQNVKYPQMAKDAGITGRVFVSFVIDKAGKVTSAKILRGIGGGCDEEALRVVKAMPNWSPGKQRGRAVRVEYRLPINFVLK